MKIINGNTWIDQRRVADDTLSGWPFIIVYSHWRNANAQRTEYLWLTYCCSQWERTASLLCEDGISFFVKTALLFCDLNESIADRYSVWIKFQSDFFCGLIVISLNTLRGVCQWANQMEVSHFKLTHLNQMIWYSILNNVS